MEPRNTFHNNTFHIPIGNSLYLVSPLFLNTTGVKWWFKGAVVNQTMLSLRINGAISDGGIYQAEGTKNDYVLVQVFSVISKLCIINTVYVLNTVCI